jgi:protocatechuate 3,4-dioxygenase, beta subunit
VPYPGRTPHIHVRVSRGGERLLATQCFVKGHPQNERDGIVRAIRDERQLDSVLVDFRPLEGSRIGELTARFDVVLGLTPEDA